MQNRVTLIRFFLETDTQPFNTSATILNRTVQAQNFYLIVIIETTILAGDSGNASFSITAHDSLGNRVTVTEANLTSNNIFIDTTKPVITLNGNANTTIERYDTYTDAGATITDEDPKYNGTVSSNASSINTDTIGSYLIEYHAPADLAGNIPDNVTRMVTIQDTKHPTITALNITTNNPSGTAHDSLRRSKPYI